MARERERQIGRTDCFKPMLERNEDDKLDVPIFAMLQGKGPRLGLCQR